jgi:WD40 repeat protein
MFGTSLAQTLTSLKHSLGIPATSPPSHFPPPPSSQHLDKSVKFWQIGSSSMDLATSDPKSTPLTSAPIQSVSLQAENGIAISSDLDGVVKTWDLSTGLCNASFQTPAKGETLRDVKMVDGRLIVVWHENRYDICIWDSKKEELLHRVTSKWVGARGLRISGDGSKVFCMTFDSVQGWSMLTGEAVGKVEVGGLISKPPPCKRFKNLG